jgi:4-amino-4-deoxy-L-arabinose transferase-like glycosyltransferase
MQLIKKYLVFIIIVLALLLRFWNLENVPSSMYWDEVSQGYNAYSILQTGRDEHKDFLPLTNFKAFGDYKAPVNIYLMVPFIALFGKSTLAVRFPSALLGTLTVFFTFLLVSELFAKRKEKYLLGCLSAFLLAISPWHIQLSRGAYEGNIATFFTVVGVYLFLVGLRKNAFLWVISIVSFVIAFYAFNAHRVFIPLLVCVLFILYSKELFNRKKMVISGVLFGLLLLIPFIFYLQTSESRLRFNEVNIFSDITVIKDSNQLRKEDGSIVGEILHNRRVLFSILYIQHYFDFFNPSYLFFSGDINPRFSLHDTGELYVWELPFLLVGFYILFRYKNKSAALILLWFFLSPVAGATARETPHALRSEMFLPMYQIIGALGIETVISLLRKSNKFIQYTAAVVTVVVVSLSFIIFVHDYFVHYPITFSYEWQFGYKEAIQEVEKRKDSYDVVAFTQHYGRPYIYALFYSNSTPQNYWDSATIVRDSFGFYTVSKFGKYEFREEVVNPQDGGKKVLYVGAPGEIPDYFKVIKKINFLDGNPAFILAEN